MTVLKESKSSVGIVGDLTAKAAGEHIGEMLEELGLAENQFAVTFTAIGISSLEHDKTMCPSCGEDDCDGVGIVASTGVVGASSEEDGRGQLIRAFGMLGVQLLNTGADYPELIQMVQGADQAMNDGKNGSIAMIDGNAIMGGLANALQSLRGSSSPIDFGDDDSGIPQA